LKLLVTSLYFT